MKTHMLFLSFLIFLCNVLSVSTSSTVSSLVVCSSKNKVSSEAKEVTQLIVTQAMDTALAIEDSSILHTLDEDHNGTKVYARSDHVIGIPFSSLMSAAMKKHTEMKRGHGLSRLCSVDREDERDDYMVPDREHANHCTPVPNR